MKISHPNATYIKRVIYGFSLVEVTIAMGIVASVLIALLALLPYGMDNIREAKNTLVTARIANELMGELQQADWGTESTGFSRLKSYDKSTRLYDGEGTRLEETVNKSPENAVYKARIEIPTEEPNLPGDNTKGTRDYRRKAIVKVAFAPGNRSIDFESQAIPPPFKTYTTTIVKMTMDKE